MDQERDMQISGTPEFELTQIEDQIEKRENDLLFTQGFGQILTILCCG